MEVLKDKDCTMDTPVVLGVQDSSIYGKGISIKPRVDGRKDSKHFESIYLPELLPLEEYDLIVVLISGGKDSIACFGIKGIVDISNTKINGIANNLTLDKYEIPVMGGVSG